MKPNIAIVANIDDDHLGHYQDSQDCIKQSFIDFLKGTPEDALIIWCAEDAVLADLTRGIKRTQINYGFSSGAMIRAADYRVSGSGCTFNLMAPDFGIHEPVSFSLRAPGHYQVLNALAVIACGLFYAIKPQLLQSFFSGYVGVFRRFNVYDNIYFNDRPCTMVDDYGHHPNEIQSVLEAIKDAWPQRRLWVVFQPHRYSRTAQLFDAFVEVLGC